MTTRIVLPSNALVMPVGPAGCGKSTFGATHFPATAIVSSDRCRAMVSDDETNQECNTEAFALFHQWIEARLKLKRLVYADATNLRPAAREKLVRLAKTYGAPIALLRFTAPLDTCLMQNARRTRFVPEHVVEKHVQQAEEQGRLLKKEGWPLLRDIVPGQQYEVVVESGVRKGSAPGYDVIGDIHGCVKELAALIFDLGYDVGPVTPEDGFSFVHPEGRKLVFVGDITDRGPDNAGALALVKLALEGGHLAVMGNHDHKLMRALRGNPVKAAHGLAGTLAEIEAKLGPAERATYLDMLENLPYQLRLTVPGHADLIVAHAGLPPELVGLDNRKARDHALYGEVLGFENGMPIRGACYRHGWISGDDKPMLVHGHTVTEHPHYLWSNVVNVDGGCCFGGELRAFRYPEGEIVRVAAHRNYAEDLPDAS